MLRWYLWQVVTEPRFPGTAINFAMARRAVKPSAILRKAIGGTNVRQAGKYSALNEAFSLERRRENPEYR